MHACRGGRALPRRCSGWHPQTALRGPALRCRRRPCPYLLEKLKLRLGQKQQQKQKYEQLYS